MKYFKLVLTSVVVLAVAFLFIQKPPVAQSPVIQAPQVQEYCFKKEFNKDITEVRLSINGTAVSGTMNWIPFEKDSARGTLSGAVLPNGEMDLLYDYIIEGSHQTETKRMKIESGKLLIKHGELLDPKYDGHLVYKDVLQAVYNETLDPCTTSL